MFSQLRNLTASISQEMLEEAGVKPRSNPTDSHNAHQAASTSQLAESALSSLRKSFAPQRSGSPGPSAASRGERSSTPERNARPTKSRLEERLRAATFAIGDLSNATTPNRSSRASPVPVPPDAHPLSPKSTPLPNSPPISPSGESEAQLNPIDSVVHLDLSQAPLSTERPPSPPDTSHAPPSSTEKPPTPSTEDCAPIPSIEPHPEADIPLPESPNGSDDTSSVPAPEKNESDPDTHSESLSRDDDSVLLPAPEPAIQALLEQPRDDDGVRLSVPPEPPETRSEPQPNVDTESLQERLKLVEQRFSDVSKSFKRLQAEKLAADKILQELTSIEGWQDADGLRSFFQNHSQKIELYQMEVKNLTEKLTRQDERIEELRDTHRLESHSQSEHLDRLRAQLEETELLFNAAQESLKQVDSHKEEMERLRKELEQQKTLAKEEEEKRIKAVSLLKTVRQKTVKVEKDREDAVKELQALKEKSDQEREHRNAERLKLQKDVDEANSEKDTAIRGLKAQFDRELVTAKQRHEKEVAALKSQFELEALTTKATHAQEISTKNSKISTLENSVNNLSREKNSFFEQLQLRQAELESSQSHSDFLKSENTELQYQLREMRDRISQLKEEVGVSKDAEIHAPGASVEDVARLLSAAEAKYELKVSELRRKVDTLERERNENEMEWSKKLREKTREIDEMKRILDSSAKSREKSDVTVTDLNNEIQKLKDAAETHTLEFVDLRAQISRLKEERDSSQVDLQEYKTQKAELENRIQEYTSRDSQLRSANKTLREELRKVQSSAALLERQRNPGVGYWTTHKDGESPNTSASRTSISSASDSRSNTPSVDTNGTPSSPRSEEEVNLEYLRNVILQFLEHKEMRPNLVRVLSIILRFTPQETRRLMAKV